MVELLIRVRSNTKVVNRQELFYFIFQGIGTFEVDRYTWMSIRIRVPGVAELGNCVFALTISHIEYYT